MSIFVVMVKSVLYKKTPLVHSPALSARAQNEIWLKMDCEQPTGSFKIRGMSNLVDEHLKRGNTSFVCSSGGNAGLSLAWAAAQRGTFSKIVVPNATSQAVVDKIEATGANCQRHGNNWPEADQLAREICTTEGAIYVSPFDDPLLWEGHSSIVVEDSQFYQENEVAAIVASCGGGGLLQGILQGAQQAKINPVLIGGETHGAASLALGLQKGPEAKLDKIDTIASSLGAPAVLPSLLAQKTHKLMSYGVSDAESLEGIQFLKENHDVWVEPACGVAVCAALREGILPYNNKNIVIVVCGGIQVGQAARQKWMDATGYKL